MADHLYFGMAPLLQHELTGQRGNWQSAEGFAMWRRSFYLGPDWRPYLFCRRLCQIGPPQFECPRPTNFSTLRDGMAMDAMSSMETRWRPAVADLYHELFDLSGQIANTNGWRIHRGRGVMSAKLRRFAVQNW